jgi:hypothetical protein
MAPGLPESWYGTEGLHPRNNNPTTDNLTTNLKPPFGHIFCVSSLPLLCLSSPILPSYLLTAVVWKSRSAPTDALCNLPVTARVSRLLLAAAHGRRLDPMSYALIGTRERGTSGPQSSGPLPPLTP